MNAVPPKLHASDQAAAGRPLNWSAGVSPALSGRTERAPDSMANCREGQAQSRRHAGAPATTGFKGWFRKSPFWGVLILAGTISGMALVLYFFNPSTHSFYPECQFHRLTGLDCPGCGMTRAAYALLHGEWAAAVRDNALLVGGLVWLAARGGWFGLRKLRHRPNGEFFRGRHFWWLLALMLVFTVLRNLPAWAFLAP